MLLLLPLLLCALPLLSLLLAHLLLLLLPVPLQVRLSDQALSPLTLAVMTEAWRLVPTVPVRWGGEGPTSRRGINISVHPSPQSGQTGHRGAHCGGLHFACGHHGGWADVSNYQKKTRQIYEDKHLFHTHSDTFNIFARSRCCVTFTRPTLTPQCGPPRPPSSQPGTWGPGTDSSCSALAGGGVRGRRWPGAGGGAGLVTVS